MSHRPDLKAQSRQAHAAAKRVRPHAVPRAGVPEFSADDILDKAEELMETGQYELASRFCDKILAGDAENARALETKALACLELTQTDEARALLQRAAAVEPDEGHSKFMYLAQLLEGQPAVDAFSSGITLLHAELEELMANPQGSGLSEEEFSAHVQACSAEISTAFCSVAEIYMSDLCHEEGAQEACISCAEKALQYDPRNVQAMQTMASLSLSLQQPEQALTWLKQSVALWHRKPVEQDGLDDEAGAPAAAAAAAAKGDDSEWVDMEDSDDVADPPPYLFRINTAKLLLELQQYETAVQILDILLGEDEEVAQVWYLLGWAHHLQNDFLTAAGYFAKLLKVYAAVNCDDQQILDHAHELLASYPPFAEPVPEF